MARRNAYEFSSYRPQQATCGDLYQALRPPPCAGHVVVAYVVA